MKKVLKTTLGLAAAAVLCLTASGCGKETFDVTETAELTFSGYNGYGTCELENEYDWIDDVMDWYGDSITDSERRSSERELEDVVTYSVKPEEGLSNGDTVTVSIKVGKAAEDYAFNLKATDITFTVEGLEEITEVDPFEDIQVVFEGKSPNGTAKMNNNSNDYTISYEMDKNSGLSNGDTVTVTAALSYGMKEDEYAQQYGKKLSVTEKTFTVEGLSAYARSIDEIPEEMYSKMQKQAEDSITSYCAGWDEGNTLKNLEFIGYYFLTAKDGFSPRSNNELYCIYKCTASFQGAHSTDEANEGKDRVDLGTTDEVFYTYYKFSDIMLLPDGTCSVDLSAGSRCYSRAETSVGYWMFGWSFRAYTVEGYTELDSMFNDVVTKNIEQYAYENTVK